MDSLTKKLKFDLIEIINKQEEYYERRRRSMVNKNQRFEEYRNAVKEEK